MEVLNIRYQEHDVGAVSFDSDKGVGHSYQVQALLSARPTKMHVRG